MTSHFCAAVIYTTCGADQMLTRDKKRYRDDAIDVDAGVISTPRKGKETQVSHA